MIWNFLMPVMSAGLTVIVLWFWKPWAGAYAEEKGKTLARKEDLDAILAEVKAVTVTQKEIETHLSDKLWNKQSVWTHKRDAYTNLIAASYNLIDAFNDLGGRLEPENATSDSAVPARSVEKIGDRLNKVANLHVDLVKGIALCRLFCSEECCALINQYVRREKANTCKELTSEWSKYEAANLYDLHYGLLAVAKRDLGVP